MSDDSMIEPWIKEVPPNQLPYLIAAVVGIVIFSGVCSGLTLAMFALDVTELRVIRSTPSADRTPSARAARLLSILKRHHFVLVALLLSNVIVMTALPLVLNQMVNEQLSLILSVTAVLIFGEIVPQAVFVKFAFPVCSWLLPFVCLLMLLTSPVSYPVAKLLDAILGDREDLHWSQLPNLFLEASELSKMEISVMMGAAKMTKLTAKDLNIVPLDNTQMLPSDMLLTPANLMKIKAMGRSRLPVYQAGNKSHILGVVTVRRLLQAALADSGPTERVGSCLQELLRVTMTSTLSEIYAGLTDRDATSRVAAVYSARGTLEGFLTLADVFHALHKECTEHLARETEERLASMSVAVDRVRTERKSQLHLLNESLMPPTTSLARRSKHPSDTPPASPF